MNKQFNYKIFFTIFFSSIYILRVGLVYSYPNDQLWTHYNLWLHNINYENDLFYYSNAWNKSIWFPIFNVFKILNFNPIVLYYIFQITHIILFFFILFQIIDHFLDVKNIEKYLIFGLLVSCTNFWISGSLANFHDIGFGYRTTPYILGLFSFYFLIKNRLNISLICLLFGSLMHLPVVAPFYLILVIYLKKFTIHDWIKIFFLLLAVITFVFSKADIIRTEEIKNLATNIFNLRINYMYIKNWSLDMIIRYFGTYIFYFFIICYINKKIKIEYTLLIIAHLFYMIFVILFNDLSNFSVFRLGREQIILVIFIFTIFLNLNLNNAFIKIIFYTALFSQFIFGSYALFLILSLFMFFLETDTNKNKISSNIFKSLIKNYK
jgi:hypothetical protein